MTIDRRFRNATSAQIVATAYSDLLDSWLPDIERRHVPTPVGKTFVLSSGPEDAPPVVLLHGSGSTAFSWAREIAALSRRYRVHAVDLPGEAGSSTPERLPLTPGPHAAWLAAVTDELGAPEAAVVGVSLGGWVGIDYATSNPGRVSDLILFSPSGIGPRKMLPLLAAAGLTVLGDRGRSTALRYLTGPRPKNSSTIDDLDIAIGGFALTTFKHFAPRTDPLTGFDDDAIARITSAVTATFGARDRMLQAEAGAEKLRRVIPTAHVEVLTDNGHLIPAQTERILSRL